MTHHRQNLFQHCILITQNARLLIQRLLHVLKLIFQAIQLRL